MTGVIAERKTFDGVTVYVHSDGRLSTRNLSVVFGVRFEMSTMFRLIDDICLYDFAELKRLASHKPRLVRISAERQMELMAAGARARVARLREDLTYNRNPWRRSR